VTGVPDELERLWTPHRLAYVVGNGIPAGGSDKPAECPFCLAPKLPDEEGLVVARGDVVYAVLNLYPYNPGHLLICPYRHVSDYTDLDPAETVELARFSQLSMSVVRTVSGPHGFNLGMNQGSVAGAGIAAHLHQHVVPRWGGDTNFMPVIGRTKTIPQLLADTRRLLADAWAKVAPGAGMPAKGARGKRAPAKRASAPPSPAEPTPAKRASAPPSAAEPTPAKRASAKRVPAKRVRTAAR
jgi:ATP adenylyltransferase